MTSRVALFIGILCALASAIAPAAASATTYVPRAYESQLSAGLFAPESIAIDKADRIWVTDNNSRLISEFNSEGEKLSPQIHQVSERVYSAADDHSNNDLYEANDLQNSIEVYGPTGELLESFVPGSGHLTIAADNSSGPTAGRLYLAYGIEFGGGAKVVERLSESGGPVSFEGSASYISGNVLTGTPAGNFKNPNSVAVGPDGEIFVADAGEKVDEFEPSGVFRREVTGSDAPGGRFSPASIAVDPTTGDLLATTGNVIEEFSPTGSYLGQITGAETPAGSFSSLGDIAVNSGGFLYASDTHNGYSAEHHQVDIFSPSFALPKVTYPGVSEGTPTSVTLNANVDPEEGGEIKTCEFESVAEAEYKPAAANPFAAGQRTSCSQALPYSGSGPTSVSAKVSGITPGSTYYYRLLVENAAGHTREALPQTFNLQAPSAQGLASSNLTETTADLSAKVNPEGGETTCYFEYGISTAYGQSAPCPSAEGRPAGDVGSSGGEQLVTVHLTNLAKGGVYHFRLVAKNPFGITTTEDQSFNFLPTTCPNAHLRQQTGTEFLPDCRAYELVSPADAGGTILLAEGPQSPLATNPSRFAYGGVLGVIPEAGGDPPDVLGDLYVSTRTTTGWVSRYVGPPGTLTAEDNGPPNEGAWIEDSPSGVFGDLSMDRFMDWIDPYEGFAHAYQGQPGSYAPYLWDASGASLGRLPTNLGEFAGGEAEGERLVGAVKPSPEFNHYFFSSTAALAFAPGALNKAPGSAYDDNLEEKTVSPISKLPNGEPIEEGEGEFITFPGVSTDGSHVLMSDGYDSNYEVKQEIYTNGAYVNAERHLFMRVGGGPGGVTYPIALGHAVHYAGISGDGTKVYFTSAEKLTPEAEDTSTNLYMWSEKGELENHPLTLISKPNGAATTGTPVCPPTQWTTECGAVPYPVAGPEMAVPDATLHNGPGGNGSSDNAIASENGDIYFYSPQQLDGSKGIYGQQNLYDYRNGEAQYVTTFNSGAFCEEASNCSKGPMVRIQISPNDQHMAFLTASKITSYENAGYLEMYTYDPATGGIHCVSCIPDGAPPTSNVEASDNGTFMTNDGRAFFSTADPLVPQDTDSIRDIYEYTEGRPQLISSGTSFKEVGISVAGGTGMPKVGLIGVSANGSDAYFSTYDTLVARDHNGSALKFYDARTDGGFAEPPAPAPCAAAEECAGPSSSLAPLPESGTRAELGTRGNLAARSGRARKHKKHHKRKVHARSHRAPHANRGGRK